MPREYRYSLGDLVLMRLADLESIECGDQEHRLATGRWIRHTRDMVQRHLELEKNPPPGPGWPEVPAAVVAARGGPGHRYPFRIGDLQQDQVPLLWLDLMLTGGDTVQASDVGPALTEAVMFVRGHRLRLALNVPCGTCGELGCPLIEIPPHWPANEPYVLRRCACGDVWRQYPQLVNEKGSETLIGPRLSRGPR